MVDYLSESEMDRIAEFVATPKYERKPEILVPDKDEVASDGERDPNGN